MNTEVVNTLTQLKLLLELSKHKDFKGTVKDFSGLLGGENWNPTHYKFVKKMIDIGVLVRSSPPNVTIQGKVYPYYEIDIKKLKSVFIDFFASLLYENEKFMDDVFCEILKDNHYIF